MAEDAPRLRPTSKMSHDGTWRAACNVTTWILLFRFDHREVARGVTDPGVGSGALLALSGRLKDPPFLSS
jgi:hypothetical protein